MRGTWERYRQDARSIGAMSRPCLILMYAAAVSVCLGCRATEHHFTPADLPRELQATQWQSPRSIDLSASSAARAAPRIASGDEVEVTLASGPEMLQARRTRAIVADDGTVEIPLAGRVSVVAPRREQSPILLASADTETTSTPEVQVSLIKERQVSITISGAVEKPGVYALPRSSCDLVSALASAGGMSRDAGLNLTIQSRPAEPVQQASGRGKTSDTDGIVVVRPDSQTPDTQSASRQKKLESSHRDIDLSTASQTDLAAIQLKDGDVIVVERHEPPAVIVQGLVRKVGRYEFPVGEEFRILDAIACAEGMSNKVIDTVHVCRIVPGKSERAVIAVSLRAASRNQQDNLVLMPGDIVSAEPNASLLFHDGIKYLGAAAMGVASAVAR